MPDPTIVSTSADGRRRLSESHRAAMRAAGKAKFAALPPEEQEAWRERMRAMGRARAKPPAPPPKAGPRNPLDDALGAPGRGGAGSPGRSNGHVAPPQFIVPDFPQNAPAGGELEDLPQPTPDELAGFTVDPAQIADLLSMPFDFMADRRGDHWRLRPLERERLAGAMARKINEHAAIARALDAGGDWILILGGLAVVISTRLAEDARHADRPDPDVRPGLAGIRLPGRPGPSRAPAPPAARADPRPVHLDGARAGSINGVPTGTFDDESDPAVAAEPARQLAQAFS